jgi:hypothetical protein
LYSEAQEDPERKSALLDYFSHLDRTDILKREAYSLWGSSKAKDPVENAKIAAKANAEIVKLLKDQDKNVALQELPGMMALYNRTADTAYFYDEALVSNKTWFDDLLTTMNMSAKDKESTAVKFMQRKLPKLRGKQITLSKVQEMIRTTPGATFDSIIQEMKTDPNFKWEKIEE